MSVLDWTFVLLLSLATVCLFFGVVNVVRLILLQRSGKRFSRRPPKQKKKRKTFLKARRLWLNQKKRIRSFSLVFLIITILASGGAFLTRNFQQNRLPGEDAEIVSQSYFALSNLEEQLQNFEAGENPTKTIKNIEELSRRLNNYGVKRASSILTAEKQSLLNRYYSSIQRLGANLENQTEESLRAEGVLSSYLTDVEKIKGRQTEVFEQFKVNQEALENRQ